MSISRRALLAGVAATAAAPIAASVAAADRFIVLGSTTTTENSGLLDHLTPKFEAATGIEARVVVAGTGKILKLAENGDIDVSLTHDPEGEKAFVAAGLAAYRREIMRNDFLIAGPREDPAGAGMAQGARSALTAIAKSNALFYSRGDDSGTHRRERTLWAEAGVVPSGRWYRETGAGMGATLNIAVASSGYVLVDRATWESFANRGELAPLIEGVDGLENVYGVLLPSPTRNPHLRTADAEAFIEWLAGPEGRFAIAAFRINGKQVFEPIDQGAAEPPTE